MDSRPKIRSAPAFRRFAYFGTLSLAGAAFTVVAGILMFSPSQNMAIASLESAAINEELKSLSINIQLKDISYSNNADSIISSAITEIGNTDARHMNPAVLKNEEEDMISEYTDKSEEIDKLFNEILN
ncbi:hypothetical protein A3I34_01760 [Candidatus Jorgensenbacteria bacterium RIFCSPLOWO2_02_FULL_45_12]|nr:MAG: hypothetical protein A3I34_01760 [Candidatus Jorgensenbacteria bacterium RIFCSPLOWO2_02_FULL_45_12]